MMIVRDILDHFIPGEWHPFEADFTVLSEDGAAMNGAVMRRRVDGKIQYRPMTEEELISFEDAARFS
jgi:hypothetical protein